MRRKVSASGTSGGAGVGVLVGVGVKVGPPGVMVAVGVNVGPPGVMVAVGVGVFVGVAVGVGGGAAAQIREMVLDSNVTAAFRARARPAKLVPVFRLMLVSARIFPMNAVPVLRVTELATFHHTLQDEPIPLRN